MSSTTDRLTTRDYCHLLNKISQHISDLDGAAISATLAVKTFFKKTQYFIYYDHSKKEFCYGTTNS